MDFPSNADPCLYQLTSCSADAAAVANFAGVGGTAWAVLGIAFCLVLFAIYLALAWRSGGQHKKPLHILGSHLDGAIQCPNCGSAVSEERDGSFEKRVCSLCGHRFELKD